jgi:hypothetical protein
MPDAVESYAVPDVYTYLAELRERGAPHQSLEYWLPVGMPEPPVRGEVGDVRLESRVVCLSTLGRARSGLGFTSSSRFTATRK